MYTRTPFRQNFRDEVREKAEAIKYVPSLLPGNLSRHLTKYVMVFLQALALMVAAKLLHPQVPEIPAIGYTGALGICIIAQILTAHLEF